MTTPKLVADAISHDLLRTAAKRVIYLEGESDPELFFGLLGVPKPSGTDFFHKDTLVTGLSARRGSGKKRVEQYVFVGQSRFPGQVFGIVDGDGEALATLALRFDPPHPGPLFAWKAYSIESLFAHLPWPTTWGAAPDWKVELGRYAPYVAINRLRRTLEQRLDVLRLAKFWKPDTPLETIADVEAALNKDKGLLSGLDVAIEFGKEIAEFQTALANSVEEGLVMFNGKWLLSHFLVERLGQTPTHWSTEWTRRAESIGGLAAVRELWERITGAPP